MAVPAVRVKPRLRGVFHQYAFFVSLVGGILLVLFATTTEAAVAAAIYAASVSALFGVSALYHRVTWTHGPDAARRLDHAMIFLLIAGTYTPVSLLVPGHTRHRRAGRRLGRSGGRDRARASPGPARPDGSGGPSTWPLAGWRWWPCRSCSPGWAWPAGC